ncbi:hypothetical protein EJB05_43287 [Eragrostis curvula]|uniref:Uncharacterized protein n=1 Tax=Eragrostis curvula TaxID=38414 RepID=A0A5J9TGM5_9POAL|nr:hypothetical protein EJB05_43287 [Eragrostis curvula]
MAPAYCPKSPAAFPSAASGLERSTALAIFSGSPASALPLRGWPNPLPIREGTKMDSAWAGRFEKVPRSATSHCFPFPIPSDAPAPKFKFSDTKIRTGHLESIREDEEEHIVYASPDSPAESFVTDDDDNSNMSEEEDEEYFIFAGRGL